MLTVSVLLLLSQLEELVVVSGVREFELDACWFLYYVCVYSLVIRS